jgi:hypothetical protein
MTKDEALRLAWEALEYMDVTAERYVDKQIPEKAITAIKAALEAKDEPVACADNGVVNWIADKQFMHEAELYIAPPQRTWVGLTDEEKNSFWKADQMTQKEWDELFSDIEAKLKQKNT